MRDERWRIPSSNNQTLSPSRNHSNLKGRVDPNIFQMPDSLFLSIYLPLFPFLPHSFLCPKLRVDPKIFLNPYSPSSLSRTFFQVPRWWLIPKSFSVSIHPCFLSPQFSQFQRWDRKFSKLQVPPSPSRSNFGIFPSFKVRADFKTYQNSESVTLLSLPLSI